MSTSVIHCVGCLMSTQAKEIYCLRGVIIKLKETNAKKSYMKTQYNNKHCTLESSPPWTKDTSSFVNPRFRSFQNIDRSLDLTLTVLSYAESKNNVL